MQATVTINLVSVVFFLVSVIFTLKLLLICTTVLPK